MTNIILERHKYAPELTRIIFPNGATLKTPGAESIMQARSFYLAPVTKWVKRVIVKKIYPEKYAGLNRTYTGCIKNYKQLATFKKDILEATGHGKKLLNGDTLPRPEIRVLRIYSKFI